ncbi:glycerophosphodiester phosphodiesterase family protein [Luethyella okanaganae]|uniref:Glycerophosphodiester phosphodiesterase family protein n=1 Tax=Luethyella okanaganae TaxID=69372 RepID=A0ABW1VF29_9MICO
MSSRRGGTYLDTPWPRVLAHRGLAIEAPENTLLAFLKALSTGATHVETDVHATLDGIAVISHDRDLSRLVGRDIRVDQLTLAELKRIDLGHGQSFASLAEALDAFPETRFNIDVKSDDAIEATALAVRHAGAVARVLVTSFSESRRQRTVALLPGVASSASAPRFALALLAARLGMSDSVRRALDGLVAVQIPEHAAGLRIVTPRLLRAVHRAGLEVHVWTVNEPADMTRLLDLGVDGLVTDRCDVAVSLVGSRG